MIWMAGLSRQTARRHAGLLDDFGLSRDECGSIIMKARARFGWIDEK